LLPGHLYLMILKVRTHRTCTAHLTPECLSVSLYRSICMHAIYAISHRAHGG
jgi:hypothetical protein